MVWVHDEDGGDEVHNDDNNNKPCLQLEPTDCPAREAGLSPCLRFSRGSIWKELRKLTFRWGMCSPGCQPALLLPLPGPRKLLHLSPHPHSLELRAESLAGMIFHPSFKELGRAGREGIPVRRKASTKDQKLEKVMGSSACQVLSSALAPHLGSLGVQ